MATCSSDDESLSQALLPELSLPLLPDTSVNVTVPNPNRTSNSTIRISEDNNTSVSSISTSFGTCHPVSTVDHAPYLSHPCYTVLNGGRRNLLKNMKFRIELLNSILAMAPGSYLPSNLCDESHVIRFFSTYKAYLKAPRKWNRAVMARAICEFDSIMKEAQTMVASSTASDVLLPPALREFYSYMDDVRSIAAIVENEPLSNKKGRFGAQSAGKRLQDCVNMKDLTRDKLDISNCANCKHNFVLPVGLEQNEINHHNDKVKIDYREAMYAYNHKSKSRKGDKKPKMGRTMSMKLACLCTRMHCLNRNDGFGCLKCEWSCIESVKQGQTCRPYFDKDNDCKCSICKCHCSVVYYRNEEKKMAAQAKEDIIRSLDTKPQSKINNFFGFTNAIANLASKRVKENPVISSSSLLGLTSEDLLRSIELQQDVDLRNTLQTSVGNIKSYELKNDAGEISSIAEIRRAARIKRFQSPHKVNSHLPVSVTQDDASIITPAHSVATNGNSRWYRNDLSHTPIDLSEEYRSDAAVVTTGHSKISNQMHTSVMKRLLSDGSPTSSAKRKCLLKMCDGDNVARTIINLSVEMGSTVDEAKNMIINNCGND